MRCQSYQHTTSERKWVTKQENLLKWIINGRNLKGLFIAGCSLCLTVFAVSPHECGVEKEGEQEETCSQETWYKLCLPEKTQSTHFWVSTKHNTTDPFFQQKRDLIAVCGTVEREKTSGNLCSQDPWADMLSQELYIEMRGVEVFTIWASVYNPPMTLQAKYWFNSSLSLMK